MKDLRTGQTDAKQPLNYDVKIVILYELSK
jgi:hypothetical protein